MRCTDIIQITTYRFSLVWHHLVPAHGVSFLTFLRWSKELEQRARDNRARMNHRYGMNDEFA